MAKRKVKKPVGKLTKNKTVKVQFDSSALKATEVKAINRAIQGAVVAEIARMDLIADAKISRPPDRTDGIWIEIPIR